MTDTPARPPVLSREMAEELVSELQGLRDSADDPDQYDDKIAALNAIAVGMHRVVRGSRVKTGGSHG